MIISPIIQYEPVRIQLADGEKRTHEISELSVRE